MSRRMGLRWDPFLREYLGTVKHLLQDRTDRSVLDVAAGSQWLRGLGFRDYTGLDLRPPNETWDLNDPLPDHHVGRYDLVTWLGALHYAVDPHRSLAEVTRALRPAGEVVLSVPWLFPPHDRAHDHWRIAPRMVQRLLAPRFEGVRLYLTGSAWHLLPHVAKRYLSGPFRDVGRAELEGVEARAYHEHAADRPEDVPTPWLRPVNVVAYGRLRPAEGGGS